MKLMKAVLSGVCLTISLFLGFTAFAQDAGQTPDTAFDPINNRYLMVWSEPEGGGATIKGKFVGPDGSELTSPEVLSPARPTQGCFYGSFDSDNGDISTPTNCAENLNPTVSYNNGQYLIAWEVKGQAASPSAEQDNTYINIFARIVDATSLAPLTGWEEGILISKVFIAANNADACANGKFACNDGEIQAWSQSQKPHVAPRVGSGGFVVTWESNKDFIGCANSERRRGWSVYGRFIDQNFSATSTTNPPMFAIFKDDSTIETSCAPLDNVDNGNNPRIAANQSSNDFIVVYEVARANGGRASIGAKRVTVDDSGQGTVAGSMMADIVASVDGFSLTNPDVVAFKNNYVLFVEDSENQIRVKSFSSGGVSDSAPAVVELGGGSQNQPKAGSNLGDGGQGPTTGLAPERLLLTFRQDGNISGVLLNEGLDVVGGTVNISAGIASQNANVEIASNTEDLLVVWEGENSGLKVFSQVIDTEEVIPTGEPPTAPGLVTPNDGVTFAPIRAYLSWDASTDPDGDDGAITYNVYVGVNTLPGSPQITGLTTLDFVVGPETQGMTGITLQANTVYKWAIEARDEDGNTTLSAERTLNTDNSVIGWWRFDENPAGPVCAGGSAGESVCDSSGNNNHGVSNGGPMWIMPGMPDILGGAISFDGTDDYIEIDNVGSLNLTNDISIITSYETESAATEERLVNKLSPGSPFNGYNFDITAAGKFRIEVCNSSTICENAESIVTPTLGNIYRVVGTYDQNNVKLYVDGSLEDTSPLATFNIGTTTQPFFIGRWQGIFAQGQIQEVILLNKALSTDETINDDNSVIP